MGSKKMTIGENNILFGFEPSINYSEIYPTLGHMFLDCLKNYENNICMIDATTDEQLTYKQLLEKSLQSAQSLKLLGFSKGEVLAICSENHLNFFIPIIAASFLGVAVAPLNYNYTELELIDCLNISKPKAIFCSIAVARKISPLCSKIDFINNIVTLETQCNVSSILNFNDFLSLAAETLDVDDFRIPDLDSKEHVAYILCSSGTTGLPKGVMLTHYNYLVGLSVTHNPKLDMTQESYLAFLPLFHVFGLNRSLVSIIHGTKIVVMKKFEMEMFLQLVEKYKIASLMLVPPILIALTKTPLLKKYDLSSVKQIGTAAAPLAKNVEDTIREIFKLKGLVQGYGMTEIALAVLKTKADNTKSGTVGVLCPFLQCKVCDLKTGAHLGAFQKGELCFKGPQVMKGYCGNELATKEVIDEHGFIHTGDVGYYDEEGNFYIVDRIKELIKFKGYQVAPAELEHLLLTHPAIKDVAVIGKPDEVAGELPLAFVVKDPEENLTAVQIQQFVARKVSPQKRLHGGVIFIDEIPKNPSGKILRRKLRELLKHTSKL